MAQKVISYTVIILSVLFAVVQYNDPDALLWITIYLFVAYLGFLNLKNLLGKKSFILIAILFLLWGINQFPPSWEGVLLNEIGMKTLNIELGRESLGLFINAIWCLCMAFIRSK